MVEEPLRICLLSYRGNPRSGGQGIYVRLLSKELAEMGHQVDVWSGPPYPEIVDAPRVSLLEIPSLDLWNEEALFRILKNPNCTVILSKKRDFYSYGIQVEFKDEALKIIAQRAIKQGTGARGLVNIVENILMKFEKRLPSTNIDRFSVTAEVVEHPERALQNLLSYRSMKTFQERFLGEHGIVLEFSDEAIQTINRLADEKECTFDEIATEAFQNYEHGLKLAKLGHFVVSEEVMKDPRQYLDQLIAKKKTS